MQTIEHYLPDLPFFRDFDPATITLLAGCAVDVRIHTDEFLFHQGEPADHFYVLRRGRVAIEIHDPKGGGAVLDTVEGGDVVGWSWMIPPYRWTFDARASLETSAIAFDGARLRETCESDPLLAYLLMQRCAQVMNRRLQSARVRLLDLYGGGHR